MGEWLLVATAGMTVILLAELMGYEMVVHWDSNSTQIFAVMAAAM